MSDRKFAVQSGQLLKAIYVGSIHRNGASFARKEDATADVLNAVAQFVMDHYEGAAIIRVGDYELDIDVKETA